MSDQPTTVVHIRDVNTADEDVVYIGRAIPRAGLPASKWANPFKMRGEATRLAVIRQYADYLQSKQAADILAAISELRGKRLACWCSPKACHGNVLADLANRLDG